MFDSIIVIVSFIFLLIGSEMKLLGLLRVLRLIKVVSGMKKVVDDKRERQQAIKEQKKNSSTMASYVERVLEFMERNVTNMELPKTL